MAIPGAEMIGTIKSDFNATAGRGFFGDMFGGLGYLTPSHWGGMARGVGDILWQAPKATVRDGIYVATRDEIAKAFPELATNMKDWASWEMVDDITKPFTYFGGHMWHKVIKPFDITNPGSWFKSAGGLIGAVPAAITGIASGIAHIVPDIVSLPFHIFGATNKVIAGGFRRFFAGAEKFGEQMMVTSDYVERGLNRIMVPEAWRGEHETEYQFITKYGVS